jgi:hypothetical protein
MFLPELFSKNITTVIWGWCSEPAVLRFIGKKNEEILIEMQILEYRNYFTLL